MERKDFYIPSRDGVHKLHVVLWEPDMAPRAVVQISHGMTEMIDRYEDFALFLTCNGYAVIGNDHPSTKIHNFFVSCQPVAFRARF